MMCADSEGNEPKNRTVSDIMWAEAGEIWLDYFDL